MQTESKCTEVYKFLKVRRIQLGITQSQLASYIGFKHRSSIHRLETNKIEWKIRDVIKACEFLELSLTITNIGKVGRIC